MCGDGYGTYRPIRPIEYHLASFHRHFGYFMIAAASERVNP